MKYVRLNDSLRNRILTRLMDHRFAVEQKQLNQDRDKHGNDVYNDIYPEALRRKFAKMAEHLPSSTHIRVQFGAEFTEVGFSKSRPVSERHTEYRAAKIYGADHELSERFFDLQKRSRDLADRRSKAHKAGEITLRNCASVKQLVEAWPEVAEFVADIGTETPVVALTVPVKDLNAHFGLGQVAVAHG